MTDPHRYSLASPNGHSLQLSPATAADAPSGERAVPAAEDQEGFIWDDSQPPVVNYVALGRRLAQVGDLFRSPDHGGGLLLAPLRQDGPPRLLDGARRLAPVIVDRVRVRIERGGKNKGGMLSVAHLNTMLGSEAFLQQFRPLDLIVRTPHYLPDFEVAGPGYTDCGPGNRVLYLGPPARVDDSLDATRAFLDVMAFAGDADRTNAVAAALTVLLRNHWPGAKPLLAVTSTKSHGGKETVIQFAAGATPRISISYESADWAFRRGFVAAIRDSLDTGVINVENARLERGDRFIASAFLERLLTDSAPLLYSPGVGDPLRMPNHLVVALSTNFGTISEDLMNRALPIHLDPIGDVAERLTPIGNPKLEYLPAHREQIAAELRGMVARWKQAGSPLDEAARHPFTAWARTVGGILHVSGFTDFLGNYSTRRTHDDPVKHALGLLGAAQPDAWLRPAEWAQLAVRLSLVKGLIAGGDRDSDAGRERGMGVVLRAHRDETFATETESDRLHLRLRHGRRRFEPGAEPSTRYRFAVERREAVSDEEPEM